MSKDIDAALSEIEKRNIRDARRKANLLAQKRAKEHARRIELGSIAELAGIVDVDDATLRGAFEAIASRIGTPVAADWKAAGERLSQKQDPETVKAVMSVPKDVAVTKELRRRMNAVGLRHDTVRGEWSGKNVDENGARILERDIPGAQLTIFE